LGSVLILPEFGLGDLLLERFKLFAALGGVKENSAVRWRVASSRHTIFAVRRACLLRILFSFPRLLTCHSERKGPRPTHANESGCHPERSEGSAVPIRRELMQILRFAQNDRLSKARSEKSRSASLASRGTRLFRARFLASLGMTGWRQKPSLRPALRTATRRRHRAGYRRSRTQGS